MTVWLMLTVSRTACGLRDVISRRANTAGYGHDDWEPHMVCYHVDRRVSVGSAGECGSRQSREWRLACGAVHLLSLSPHRDQRMSTDCAHAISHVCARQRALTLGAARMSAATASERGGEAIHRYTRLAYIRYLRNDVTKVGHNFFRVPCVPSQSVPCLKRVIGRWTEALSR